MPSRNAMARKMRLVSMERGVAGAELDMASNKPAPPPEPTVSLKRPKRKLRPAAVARSSTAARNSESPVHRMDFFVTLLLTLLYTWS